MTALKQAGLRESAHSRSDDAVMGGAAVEVGGVCWLAPNEVNLQYLHNCILWQDSIYKTSLDLVYTDVVRIFVTLGKYDQKNLTFHWIIRI